MRSFFTKHKKKTLLCLFLVCVFLFFLLLPRVLSVHYISQYTNSVSTSIPDMEQDKVVFIPSYVGTPESVRGIYMTSWIASSQNLRADLVKLIDDTELNAIVIDIKDYSG